MKIEFNFHHFWELKAMLFLSGFDKRSFLWSKNEKGTAILVVFLILMVLGAVAAGLAILAIYQSTLAGNNLDYSRALQLADTGLNRMKNIIYVDPFKVDTNNDGQLNEDDSSYNTGLVAVGRKILSENEFKFFNLEDPIHPQSFDSQNYKLWGYYRGKIRPLRYSIKIPQNFELAGPTWMDFNLTYITNGEAMEGMPLKKRKYLDDPPVHQLIFPVNLVLDRYRAKFQVGLETPASSNVEFEIRFNTVENFPEPIYTIGNNYVVLGTISIPVGQQFGELTVEMNPFLETPVRQWIANNRPVGGYSGAYETDIFEVISMGIAGRASRTIRSMLFVDSFLKYARFCKHNLKYRPYSEVYGMVYVDGDLNVSYGNIFYRSVNVTGKILNMENNRFEGLVNTNAERLELPEENRLWIYKQLAKVDQNNLESDNPKGIFLSYDAPAPFNLERTGDPLRQLDLEADFDFSRWESEKKMVFGASIGPPKVIKNFNGIVYIDKSFGEHNAFVHVKGHLHGKSITIFSDDDIYINGCITMGRTKFNYTCNPPCPIWDPIVDGEENKPVNLGLVAGRRIILAATAPKILFIEAAMMALTPMTNDPMEQISWYSLTFNWPPTTHPIRNVPPYYPEIPRNDERVTNPLKDKEAIINNYRYILHFTKGDMLTDPDTQIPPYGLGNNNGRLDPYDPVTNSCPDDYDKLLVPHNAPDPFPTPYGPTCTEGVQFKRYYFPVDLDGSGDLTNRDGYDETKITTSFWFLRIKGPIITTYVGDAYVYGDITQGIWRDMPPVPFGNKLEEPAYGSTCDQWTVLDDCTRDYLNDCAEFHPNYGKNTRRYVYDPDIVANPPPYFPVLLRKGDFISYREIDESKAKWIKEE